MKENKQHILKWVLIVSIVILVNLFVNYSLSLVISAPQYNNYCGDVRQAAPIESQSVCEENGGEWQGFTGKPVPEENTGYCDLFAECSEAYDEARDTYERNIFVSLIFIGVLIFILSLVIKNNYVVSVSLGLAAALDFVVASMRYWSTAENITRVAILAIALAVLVYVAYKKFSE